MLGKRLHIGYAWLFMSLVLTIIFLGIYFVFIKINAVSETNLLDIFAGSVIAICASYLMTCLLDDIIYPFSSNRVMTMKVVDKKRLFRTFAGRGSSKVTYSYRLTYHDEFGQKRGQLICSKEHHDLIEIGKTVTCTVKGNILIDIYLNLEI